MDNQSSVGAGASERRMSTCGIFLLREEQQREKPTSQSGQSLLGARSVSLPVPSDVSSKRRRSQKKLQSDAPASEEIQARTENYGILCCLESKSGEMSHVTDLSEQKISEIAGFCGK